MIRRREFITLVGGAAAAWPVVARAQQPDSLRRIGVLMNYANDDRVAKSWIEAFRKRLREQGWTAERNLKIEERWAADDNKRLGEFATELVDQAPHVLFGFSTPTVAALQRATRTIPIVFVNANDPIGSGFVASLAKPGGNITGFVSNEPSMGGKWLELLKEIAPTIAKVIVPYNPKTHTKQYFNSIAASANTLSVKTVLLPYSSSPEIGRGIEQEHQNSGLLVPPDSSNAFHRETFLRLAERLRLPAIYYHRLFTENGGLASYGADYLDAAMKAAEYVDRILKGASASELPVQGPTKFEFVINLKAAKRIGLTVTPMLLARADEVIE